MLAVAGAAGGEKDGWNGVTRLNGGVACILTFDTIWMARSGINKPPCPLVDF